MKKKNMVKKETFQKCFIGRVSDNKKIGQACAVFISNQQFIRPRVGIRPLIKKGLRLVQAQRLILASTRNKTSY